MALDTFVVIAAQYDTEDEAVADYHDVRTAYKELGLIDTYDAAVLTRDEHGKVHIVKRVEEPTRQVGAVGLAGGLAVGALFALFPAIGLGAGLLAGGVLGAGAGATAGHIAAGMSRHSLHELGELLDEGHSGLVVIAATDAEAHVDAALKRAKKQAKAQLQADTDALKKELDAL